MITLTVDDGYLCLGDETLLCVYDEGDCDHISWPKPNMKNLARALYDHANMEDGITDEQVALPDGTVIGRLVPGAFIPDNSEHLE